MRRRLGLVGMVAALLAGCGGGTATQIVKDGINGEWTTEEVTTTDVAAPEDVADVWEVTPVDAGDVTGELPVDPGSLGYPCDGNEDCLSGFCVETEDGYACTTTCNQDCPDGWDCIEAPGTGDPLYICVPRYGTLCRPCHGDEECRQSPQSEAFCVDYGGTGHFCAGLCEVESDCPEGYGCLEQELPDGTPASLCIRTEGECGCSPKYQGLGLTTECYLENEFGLCTGQRECHAGTLTECDASLPAEESCNGLDDNCDGTVDEGTSGTFCTNENEFGVCEGRDACIDGELLCIGPVPAEEICDGIDNDCDKEVDEDFGDIDEDGISDCIDDDKDGDGVVNEADNCPAVPNEEQANHDLDTQGDACDPDDDNDLAPDETDCAPFDASIHPAAKEICDGIDQNCDGIVDNGSTDTDGDGEADCIDLDDDNDGVPDTEDNCDLEPNPGQADFDQDGLGDACDPDADGDLDPNTTDCAPLDPLKAHTVPESCNGVDDDCDGLIDEQFSDLDGDLQADCVDEDDDNDGVLDPEDNCPVTANPSQTDLDGDGIGDACEDDTDGDLDPNGSDCQPQDPTVHHGAQEACNGKDDNCNGIADEGYPDANGNGQADCIDADDDGDGVPDPEDNCPLVANPEQVDTDKDGKGNACDADDDGDGDPDVTDCKPLDPTVHGAATESCDGKDNDCDSLVDEENAEGCTTYYFNTDSDGHGLSQLSKCLCEPKSPYSALEPGDCDDTNAAIYPGANEWCNGKDDDCDGAVDEAPAIGCNKLYLDQDKDGVGAGEEVCLCGTPVGYAAAAGDCDDADATVKPGALEQCDGKDNNCDSKVDEAGSLGCSPHYLDADGDGYGVQGTNLCLCGPEGDHTATATGDCNDGDEAVHPMALEVCNGKDDNCNGQVDEGTKSTFYKDNDADGYGTPNDKLDACQAPDGYVAAGTDCNDFNGSIHPNAAELCNDIDDDCDGIADDGLPKSNLYADNDGDGHGATGAVAWPKCLPEDGELPAGYALIKDDCDDSDATVFPGAALLCDGKDNNCDGTVDRFCFSPCQGSWPFQQTYSGSTPQVFPVDLNGDGNYEVVVQSSFGFALLNNKGTALYDYSAPNYNYSRGKAVVADIDNYDQFGAGIQSLEVLTGNGSHPNFYKLQADGQVTVYTSGEGVYDASRFLASDVDFDGQVEFFTTTWCDPNRLLRVFRFNRATGTIVPVADLPDPDGVCAYTAGRAVGDLDGDGVAEFLLGNGYAYPSAPQYWGGNLYAYRLADLGTWTFESFCTPGECFLTDVEGIFKGQLGTLHLFHDSVRTIGHFFQANEPNQSNPGAGDRTFRYDLAGTLAEGFPNTNGDALQLVPTDVDDDGLLENTGLAASVGLWDLDGNGYPDRVDASGTKLRVSFWDPETQEYVINSGSSLDVSGMSLSLGGMWDMDGDGRLDVVAGDEQGHVHCYELGPGTWNPLTSLPPQVPAHYRTNQWDNFEPNGGEDTNGDGLPDRMARIPSALTAKGNFYSYLTTEDDVDFFQVDTAWGGSICLTSPPGRVYDMAVYSYLDRWNNETQEPTPDGLPDGFIWESDSDSPNKCFHGSSVYPYRYGEYRFIVAISSHDGDYSPYWPYWLKAAK